MTSIGFSLCPNCYMPVPLGTAHKCKIDSGLSTDPVDFLRQEIREMQARYDNLYRQSIDAVNEAEALARAAEKDAGGYRQEIVELREQVAADDREIHLAQQDAYAAIKRADEAEAIALAAEQDAKRYRWLRDIGDATWSAMGKRYADMSGADVDAAIDAAMEAKEAK